MRTLKQWIMAKILEYRERQKLAQEIDSDSFLTLARELKDLSLVAERLWPRQHNFYAKIKQIQTEMDQLDALASKPEFRLLPATRRVQLRKSLILTREQLIETVQSAPPPTATLQ